MNRWAQKFRAWGRNLKRFRNWTFFVGTAPAAPSDFATTAIGSTAVNFIWADNADNEDSFVFQRKLSTDSTFENCGSSAANTTEVQITGFTPSSGVDALNANIVFMWPGTNATIPSGWQRDTRFDGVYLKGAEATSDPTTGGAATHTHPNTSTSHLHTVVGGATTGEPINMGTGKGFANPNHTHLSANSAANSFSGAATDNDPPYYDMIFIKPTTGTGCPNSACALWDAATLPTDWVEHTGSKTYFLRGAPGGGNGGATGGNATHTHATNHSHANTASGNSSAGGAAATGGTAFARHTHTHGISLNSGSANVAMASTEPEWYKLRVIQNDTGSESLPNQVIALWLGNHANIPLNWARLTGPDGVFLKCASNDGEVGNTGGAVTHTHAGANHNHTITDVGASAYINGDWTAPSEKALYSHGHPWTIGNANVGLIANNSKSHYPLFQEAIFVRHTTPTTDARMRAENAYGVSDWAGPITFTMLAAGAANPDPPGA